MGRPAHAKLEILSQRAYALRRGVSHKAVQKAIASGRLQGALRPGKKLDAEAADRAWAANTDVTKPRNSVSGDPKHRRAPGAPASPARSRGSRPDVGEPTDAGLGVTDRGYTAARAMREAFAAKTAKLEYERLSGKLVEVDEVRRGAFEVGRRVRDSVLSIPDRIAPILAGLTDVNEIHRALTKELREALEALAHVERR